MNQPAIMEDVNGRKIVMIPEIIFFNKQNINWDKVEIYLKRYINKSIEMTESRDVICIGTKFPDEYSSSRYTRKTKGARAKAKANAAQGVCEMIKIATEKEFRDNHKEKHIEDANNGWYYYLTRFALPIYDNNVRTNEYTCYSARLVVNCTSKGKMYLYDIVDIKKEASNPLKTI